MDVLLLTKIYIRDSDFQLNFQFQGALQKPHYLSLPCLLKLFWLWQTFLVFDDLGSFEGCCLEIL